jgi:hypothetical protein
VWPFFYFLLKIAIINLMEMSQNIVSLWIWWHFFDMPREILKIWRNFLKFGLHYFSIPFLLKTFFSHWHKYAWQYPKGFDLAKFFEVWISNQISRLIGMIARSFLILAGLIYEIFVLIFGLLFILFWIFLPIILLLIFVYGIKFLF